MFDVVSITLSRDHMFLFIASGKSQTYRNRQDYTQYTPKVPTCSRHIVLLVEYRLHQIHSIELKAMLKNILCISYRTANP
jgi:hypothetical protein